MKYAILLETSGAREKLPHNSSLYSRGDGAPLLTIDPVECVEREREREGENRDRVFVSRISVRVRARREISMAPKMKRRDLDEAYDEFFEFSLSSPATKIRRLDAEVAPIAEKDEEPFEIEEAMGDSSLDLPLMNEERAIVLYKPIDSHLLLGPNRSNVSLQIGSDLIPGLKNGFFQRVKDGSPVDDRCSAVVPWARVSTEAAEAAVMAEEGASMEVEIEEEEEEEEEGKGRGEQINTSNGGVGDEMLHPSQRHWQWQNHCMEPQLLQQQQLLLNTTTPMMWSW